MRYELLLIYVDMTKMRLLLYIVVGKHIFVKNYFIHRINLLGFTRLTLPLMRGRWRGS